MKPARAPVSTTVRRKYGNKPVVIDGIKFDSQREAARYRELLLLQRAGKIRGLNPHPTFELVAGVKFEGDKRAKPALRFTADSEYIVAGLHVVEDVKSPATANTQAFRIRRHLMLALHGINVKVVT